jgi:hypothetical protein
MSENVKTECASMEFLDCLREQIIDAESLKACLTTGVSWRCEGIDREVAADGDLMTGCGDYRDFCTSMAEEMEAWRGEDEELWAWAWGMAAEMFDLYDESGEWTERQLVEEVCKEIDDVEAGEREPYARHLFMSAVAFIHGWSHREQEKP